ncbi:MAG: xanthine dehydrogenase family protein molybdopterin-binding subunit [Alphaproteobacteria bacterium]|nr:xanthine dehydrogenase family protein molybdopterin-binding subunit [Alphaproteobacteria bacterium]
MSKAAPPPQDGMGEPVPRIDARAKVTGAALYAADFPVANAAHAVLVISNVAKGSIRGIDLFAAKATPGVLLVLTRENAADAVKRPSYFAEGGHASTKERPLSSDRIWHDGQIVAMVVADSYEIACDAASRIGVTYDETRPAGKLGGPGTETVAASAVNKKHKDPMVGDAERAYESAPFKIEVELETPTQHHNPIELFATTCLWSDGKLTIYEPSQFVYGLKHGVAEQLGIDPTDIRVVSPFVGGAFGSKGSVTPRTALVAIAARQLGRPVKLVVARDQGFTVATYRAETRHRIRLAAARNGKLLAYQHEAWELTSRIDDYLVGGTEATTRLYAVPNAATKVNIVRADRNTPGFMRSPPEVPYVYAYEAAINELAEVLGMDPVELRRVNDTHKDPITGAPFTSRSLMRCYDEAARAFGWSHRREPPGTASDGDWLIGWGCASALYPTQMSVAAARVRLVRSGAAHVEIAAHDLGTGAYTVLAQAAAEGLGLRPEAISVTLGESSLPPGPVAGGSITTASCCNVVAKACGQIREKLSRAVAQAKDGPLAGTNRRMLQFANGRIVDSRGNGEGLDQALDRLGTGAIEEYAEWIPHGAKPEGLQKLYRGSLDIVGGPMEDRVAFAFGAEFVELRINRYTREIRVPRIVGAFASGRIMNTRTAHSQYMGAMIWGIASALHEETELDERTARYVNKNLADYQVPVNADIGEVEVIMVPEVDRLVNPLGIKGIGELANVGTAAAIAEAAYRATGKRVRKLPIRIEDLL